LNYLVSVVIPLYNKESYIIQTLRSVMNQSYTNLECVIIDDGSTDKSFTLVSKFIEESKLPWTLISQPNSGQTRARNHGIYQARGEYIAFLDSDDLWPTNKIELQVDALEKNPDSVLVLSTYAIFGEGNSNQRVVRHRKCKKMNANWLNMRGFGGGLESLGLVRKSTLDQIGLFDESLSTSSGLDLSLRLERVGKILLLPEIGLYYRISPGQWHTNIDPLVKDMGILARRYGGKRLRRIEKFQESYFYWSTQDTRFSTEFTVGVLRAFLTLDLAKLLMLNSLIFRNLLASLRGLLRREETKQFLRASGVNG
jgi:glycosyltransferase involved in cell wall biosynthesis